MELDAMIGGIDMLSRHDDNGQSETVPRRNSLKRRARGYPCFESYAILY